MTSSGLPKETQSSSLQGGIKGLVVICNGRGRNSGSMQNATHFLLRIRPSIHRCCTRSPMLYKVAEGKLFVREGRRVMLNSISHAYARLTTLAKQPVPCIAKGKSDQLPTEWEQARC